MELLSHTYIGNQQSRDYYPFGMMMLGRTWDGGSSHRYGFGGEERFTELQDNYAYDNRIYNSRIGRWLSVDPLYKLYANQSPYSFVHNSPVSRYDDGGETDYLAVYRVEKDNAGNVTKIIADIYIKYKVIDVSQSGMVDDPNDLSTGTSLRYNVDYSDNIPLTDQVIDVELNIFIDFAVVKNISQVQEGDNILFVVDNVTASQDAIGVASSPGYIAAIESKYKNNKQVILHELGHNLLGNIFGGADASHSKDSNHLMYPKINGNSHTNPEDFTQEFTWLLYKESNGSQELFTPDKTSEDIRKACETFLSTETNTSKTKMKDAGI